MQPQLFRFNHLIITHFSRFNSARTIERLFFLCIFVFHCALNGSFGTCFHAGIAVDIGFDGRVADYLWYFFLCLMDAGCAKCTGSFLFYWPPAALLNWNLRLIKFKNSLILLLKKKNFLHLIIGRVNDPWKKDDSWTLFFLHNLTNISNPFCFVKVLLDASCLAPFRSPHYVCMHARLLNSFVTSCKWSLVVT